MTWLFLSLICALAEALKDITSKRGLKQFDALTITWVFFVLTALFSTPLLFFDHLPTLSTEYLVYLFGHSLLFGASVFLYMKAISLSSLSLTVPLIMFTPIFMLITSPLTLGEWPSFMGLIGTLLIVSGSYLLNIKSTSKSIFAPFHSLIENQGSRIMLFVAFLWSITSVIDKIAVNKFSPIFWGVSLYYLISIYLTVIMLFKRRVNLNTLTGSWKTLFAVGVFNSIQLITYIFALQSGLAIYVLSIKRTSVLMVLVISAFAFGEKGLRERFLAATIMLGGMWLIANS